MPQLDEIENAVDQEKALRGLYSVTFDCDEGRKVLEHLQSVNHVMEPSHVVDSPHETAFRDGERNAVLKIMRMIQPFDAQHFRAQLTDQASHDPLAAVSEPQED